MGRPKAAAATAPVRRQPRQARARERVSRILAAAEQVLAAEGAEALNTNRIAKEAGVPVGSVYEYFPDKHAIALALLEALSERESSAILARFTELADAPFDELVKAIVRLVFTLYQQHHALYRGLWGMTAAMRRVGERPSEQLIISTVRERLAPQAAALGIIDLDLTCLTLFHLVESLSMQLVQQADAPPEACIREITRAVLGYLGLHTRA